MSALAIKCIDNPKHVQRVLRTRVALRIIPPSEGVWPCDSGRLPEGRDGTARCEASQSGGVSRIAQIGNQSHDQ